MWEIVICNSDGIFVERIQKTLTVFYGEHEMKIRIRVYPDAASLISDVDEPMDLILLSTQLSDMDGYLLAELLRTRKSKQESKLIFCGEEDGDVFAAFSYLPFGYIRKNRWDTEADDVLVRLWKYDHRERSIEVVYQRKKKRVRVSDIIYIEGQGHGLTVCCAQGETYHFRGRMAEYEALLDGYYFVHSAKSYLVNCAYVKGITSKVWLKDGGQLPCSRSCAAQTKRMWERYMREMAHAL